MPFRFLTLGIGFLRYAYERELFSCCFLWEASRDKSLPSVKNENLSFLGLRPEDEVRDWVKESGGLP